jgi:hypothetical protein
MRRYFAALFIASMLGACASSGAVRPPQDSLDSRTLASTVTSDDPAPKELEWKAALPHAIRTPFALGNEICAVGDAQDPDPENGAETAAFAAYLALDSVFGGKGVDAVMGMIDRRLRWSRADRLSHLALVCVIPMSKKPSASDGPDKEVASAH